MPSIDTFNSIMVYYHTTDLYNRVASFIPSLHREFDALWIMPLFFVISGASVHFSLKSRNAKGFIKERILRIAIPLVFIGTFVINPPQIYVQRLFHGQFDGGFFQWYPHYFNGMWPVGNFAPLGNGYLIFSNTQIQQTIKKYGTPFLIAAVILTALFLDSHFGVNLKIPGVTAHDFLKTDTSLPANHSVWIAVHASRGLIGWCWIIGILGLGQRFLNFNNRFLDYANEGMLPFYILHHTVIYIVGFYVIQWDSGIGAKYAAIAIISFMLIMAIYEILVRRVSIFRVLFGLKVKKATRNRQTALCAATGVGFLLVMALVVVSANAQNMSPAPAKPGLYINEALGFQLSFPASMSRPGNLTFHDVFFHIRHPEKTLYLKICKKAVSTNEPLDPRAAKLWLKRIMENMGIRHPQVLSTEVFTTPDGTKALHADIKFNTDTRSLFGTYVFFNKDGKRIFIAGYSDEGFEPLEQIVKGLIFK